MSNMAWWLPWLPVLGSVLVAAAAFAGVIVSNNTNREAIKSARMLDHHKWLREALLRLASEAAGHAFELDRLYNRRSLAATDGIFVDNMLAVAGESRKLSATADSLVIVGYPELAAACREMRAAADRVVDPAHVHREAVQTSAHETHIAGTRADVDRRLSSLAETRQQFVALAESTLKSHILMWTDTAAVESDLAVADGRAVRRRLGPLQR